MIVLLLLLFAVSVSASPLFIGKDGLVIMEVESTDSSLRKWKDKQEVEGFTGTSHLEFTGNKPANGPAHSPLEYRFTVDKEGVYALFIRGHKRLDGEPEDRCNDCYVRLEGDFSAVDKGAPLDVLTSDTKLFGGTSEGWGWTNRLDINHKKLRAIYQLNPGVTYTLTVSGRSQRFNMDRIVFHHTSIKANRAKEDPKQAESEKQ